MTTLANVLLERRKGLDKVLITDKAEQMFLCGSICADAGFSKRLFALLDRPIDQVRKSGTYLYVTLASLA